MIAQRFSWTGKIALLTITGFIAMGFTCGNSFAHHDTSATEAHHANEVTEEHVEDSHYSQDSSNHCCALTDTNQSPEEITVPVGSSTIEVGITAIIPVTWTGIFGDDHPSTAPPLYRKDNLLQPYSSSSFLASIRSVKRLN